MRGIVALGVAAALIASACGHYGPPRRSASVASPPAVEDQEAPTGPGEESCDDPEEERP